MKSVLAVAVVLAAGIVNAGGILSGDAAAAKFPAELRGMGLHTAKWAQLTNGVEYYYGCFTNLLGTVDGYKASRNVLHLLRIDYAKSPVRMKFVDHTQEKQKRWTTSATAAKHNALFAVNMTMEDGKGRPHGYAKADGRVIPNGAELSKSGVKGGFAFNDDKSVRFERNWLAVDPATGKGLAEAWDNVITKEAYTVHDGKPTWGPGASYFGRANYPFIGITADGVLWVCTVDGRCSASNGLGYHEVAAVQKALGCVEGVCCDGGGSTTMVIRRDLLPSSDICATQRISSDAPGYYTMNFLFDGSLGVLPNGSERKVINQLLFVPAL